jgi:hypothetical protein
VYIDHEKKMTCIDHILRPLGPIHREVPMLRSPEDALEEANRAWTARGIREVEVREVRFCYFEMGWHDSQPYLEPAYLILATLIGPDPRIRTGDIFVAPAAVNDVGSMAGLVPPRRPAQKPRAAAGR